MFKTFNEITEAALQRLNEITSEIDALAYSREPLRILRDSLENSDRVLNRQEDQELDCVLDDLAEIDNKIEQLDDLRYELRGFLEDFTNAVEKSSNIEHFLLFMQGCDSAYVYGDAPDTHPWH